jgi:hypothetical protein
METFFPTHSVSYYRTSTFHNYALQLGMLYYTSSAASLEKETWDFLSTLLPVHLRQKITSAAVHIYRMLNVNCKQNMKIITTGLSLYHILKHASAMNIAAGHAYWEKTRWHYHCSVGLAFPTALAVPWQPIETVEVRQGGILCQCRRARPAHGLKRTEKTTIKCGSAGLDVVYKEIRS